MRIPKCNSCIHYLNRGKCKAYPEQIPKEIIWWVKPHNEILEGQRGSYVFKTKYPEIERAEKEAEKNLKKELFENINRYRKKFIELLLKQLEKNNFKDLDWVRIVLEVNQKRGWDTVVEYIDFYLETKEKRIELELEYFREWRSIRRKMGGVSKVRMAI